MKKFIFVLVISLLAFTPRCHANDRIEELEKENMQIDTAITSHQRDIQIWSQRKVENFGAIKEIQRMEKIKKDNVVKLQKEKEQANDAIAKEETAAKS